MNHQENLDNKYSTFSEGTSDWFYKLFGHCFSKLYIDYYDKQYYHRVLWFKYTTDGKKCMGLYSNPDEPYPDEVEIYQPDCFTFSALFLRYIRINLCCCCPCYKI